MWAEDCFSRAVRTRRELDFDRRPSALSHQDQIWMRPARTCPAVLRPSDPTGSSGVVRNLPSFREAELWTARAALPSMRSCLSEPICPTEAGEFAEARERFRRLSSVPGFGEKCPQQSGPVVISWPLLAGVGCSARSFRRGGGICSRARGFGLGRHRIGPALCRAGGS